VRRGGWGGITDGAHAFRHYSGQRQRRATRAGGALGHTRAEAGGRAGGRAGTLVDVHEHGVARRAELLRRARRHVARRGGAVAEEGERRGADCSGLGVFGLGAHVAGLGGVGAGWGSDWVLEWGGGWACRPPSPNPAGMWRFAPAQPSLPRPAPPGPPSSRQEPTSSRPARRRRWRSIASRTAGLSRGGAPLTEEKVDP
jgi:hypothetical protein